MITRSADCRFLQNLSPAESRLLTAYGCYTNSDNLVCVSDATIARSIKRSRDNVQRMRVELQRRGFIQDAGTKVNGIPQRRICLSDGKPRSSHRGPLSAQSPVSTVPCECTRGDRVGCSPGTALAASRHLFNLKTTEKTTAQDGAGAAGCDYLKSRRIFDLPLLLVIAWKEGLEFSTETNDDKPGCLIPWARVPELVHFLQNRSHGNTAEPSKEYASIAEFADELAPEQIALLLSILQTVRPRPEFPTFIDGRRIPYGKMQVPQPLWVPEEKRRVILHHKPSPDDAAALRKRYLNLAAAYRKRGHDLLKSPLWHILEADLESEVVGVYYGHCQILLECGGYSVTCTLHGIELFDPKGGCAEGPNRHLTPDDERLLGLIQGNLEAAISRAAA